MFLRSMKLNILYIGYLVSKGICQAFITRFKKLTFFVYEILLRSFPISDINLEYTFEYR